MKKRLHDLVWSRFVRMPYGHILDYVGDDGEVIYPTAEWARRGIPNGMGWWTPIENGGFFTGLYAYSLIKEYDKYPSQKSKDEINILINGLFTLQDVARNEGFIARGVADDGVSHYPISSDDQLLPWVLAVWAYYNSNACVDKMGTRSRLLRLLLALKRSNFVLPTDWDEASYDATGLASHSGWRSVTMLLFISRVLAEMSGDEEDLRAFENIACLTARFLRALR